MPKDSASDRSTSPRGAQSSSAAPAEAPENRDAVGESCRPDERGIFRRRAIQAHMAGESDTGQILDLSPRWTRWTYRILVGSVAAALLFGFLGKMREYAGGPAIVRMPGVQDLTAWEAGTVSTVEVAPAETVAVGEVLVRLHDARERADLARAQEEFERQLAARLRNPGDRSVEAALIPLRSERDLARARLEQRTLRAPTAGVIRDVRVRSGQPVAPGETLVTLATEDEDAYVLAMLPGRYRPQLEPGMVLRFEVEGYEYDDQHLVIARIGSEVIGPDEARRYLGGEVADAVALDGAVVPVEARLHSPSFTADGRTYAYHDGMKGRVEVAVRAEPILLALFPGLEAVLDGDG